MRTYTIPDPVVDAKEEKQLKELSARYDKLIEPGKITKAGKKTFQVISKRTPDNIKELLKKSKETITQAELYEKAMKVIADGFAILEKNAAKVTIRENAIISQINDVNEENYISNIEDICLARGYDLSRIVSSYKLKNLTIAFIEGGGTGFFGFPGIPFNIVLSTFIYFRAVQSIAMIYGYDIKNNSSEMVIASEVLANAMSPSGANTSEIGSIIGKFMVMAEVTTIKQTVKKGWTAMAEHGGVALLLTQIRALANKAAAKALEKAGQAGIEREVFKSLFEQIGKKLTQNAIKKAVPFVGAGIGALFDTSMMNTIVEYADVFYNKRFILEKADRIGLLTSYESDNGIIDVEYEEGQEDN